MRATSQHIVWKNKLLNQNPIKLKARALKKTCWTLNTEFRASL